MTIEQMDRALQVYQSVLGELKVQVSELDDTWSTSEINQLYKLMKLCDEIDHLLPDDLFLLNNIDTDGMMMQ